VDAKFTSGKLAAITGPFLFWTLAAALTLGSTGVDWLAGRSSWEAISLTLPFLLAAVATWLLGCWAVPTLRALKAGQVIREDGPKAHLQKAGTPTMGGSFLVPVGMAIALLLSKFSGSVVAVCALTAAYAFVGWIDDWQILNRRSNKGITPRQKLLLQVGFGALFCIWVFVQQPVDVTKLDVTNLLLPFGLVLPLGLLFWPLAWFALVAESNAANLTDGLDGLAGGTGAIALLGLGAIIGPAHPDLMIFCAAMAGSYLGFVSHNRNPARVFMGNLGSLALGGALASVAILSQSLFALLILSGIFLAETLSVILQVGYYKATKDEMGIGRRLFRMAPLHHHLELGGWPETSVVAWFYGIGLILFLFCLVTF